MQTPQRYIYFYTLDTTGTYTTSGYSLPITPFTFIPVFDDGESVDYSNQRILWDFGDGTTSESVTATHHYTTPGWYNVKCYVLGKLGEGYESMFTQNIYVKDLISDTIAISGSNSKTQSGTTQNPFVLYRFNSWQSYTSSVINNGYKINLNVDGNVAPLLNAEQYQSDKWSHLKPSSRFESIEYNNNTEKYERAVVSSIKTTNTEIYARIFKNKLEFCNKEDLGSCFVGTSGSKLFYFVDDIPKKLDKITDVMAVTIFASFDSTTFKDFENYNEYNKFSVLNDVKDSTAYSVMIEQLNPTHLTITSNGIDDDGGGNLIKSFDIYPEKFVGQKIPFVIKAKEKNELPSKYNPLMRLTSNTELEYNQVYVELQDENNRKIDDIIIQSNFGTLSSLEKGGFFKGYLISNKELSNVKIYAKFLPFVEEKYLVDTTYGILGHPQSDYIHSLRVKIDTYDKTKKILSESITKLDGLTGIYTSCVVGMLNENGSTTTNVWVVDSDREKVKKYDAETMTLLYENYNIPENSSPSDICSDSEGNMWVTLHDSISTIKISNKTNLIESVIVSPLGNVVIEGQNTISPGSIDTDYDDNVWISYTNPISSFVEKYNPKGMFMFRSVLSPEYQITQIVTDLYKNLWGIAKDNTTKTNTLSAKKDKVFKIDKTGSNTEFFLVDGSLGNITIDAYNNVWVTKNINELTKINITTREISNFKLPTDSSLDASNYTSDLEGIACTTDNTILVVDNANKKLHYFKSEIETLGFIAGSLPFTDLGNFNQNRIQNKLNGYGDWNGFKYINKYQHKYNRQQYLEGRSSVFTVYNSTGGQYDIRKVNENFDPKLQVKNYRFQDYLLNTNVLFEDFIGTCLGTLSSSPVSLGKSIYEKIANFTDNINNVDTCNVDALKSMYEMLDEEFYVFNKTDYNIPPDLKRLIDLFSIKYSKLKGSRNKFKLNFDNKGYNNDSIREHGGTPLYGINKGKQLDFSTALLMVGNPIVAYEKYSETYRLLNTNLLPISGYFEPMSDMSFPLSSYHPYWGWGLVLPDDFRSEQIPLYYDFYEYVEVYADNQTEGVINWADDNTTLSESISSTAEWEDIKQKMIYFALAKGLGIIK